MATASRWAYYYKIRTTTDHMDTLRLYKDYKTFWDRHRIPGETKLNEVLWEDTWWKENSPMTRSPRRLPPIQSNKKSRKSRDKPASSIPNKSLADDRNSDKEVASPLPSIASSSRSLPAAAENHRQEKQEERHVIVPSADEAAKSRDHRDTSSSNSSRSSSRSSGKYEINET